MNHGCQTVGAAAYVAAAAEFKKVVAMLLPGCFSSAAVRSGFKLRGCGVTGTVGQLWRRLQRRACYGASVLRCHSYATAAWADAALMRSSF